MGLGVGVSSRGGSGWLGMLAGNYKLSGTILLCLLLMFCTFECVDSVRLPFIVFFYRVYSLNKIHEILAFSTIITLLSLFGFFVKNRAKEVFLKKKSVLTNIRSDHSSVNLEHNSLTSFGGLVNLINLKVIITEN